MNRHSVLAYLSSAGIAIGAGLASALLFALLVKGTLAALLLAYFAPLPLMIASLGFGQSAGLASAFVGSGVIATIFYPSVGALLYPLGIALPAWLVCFAALRGAPPLEPQIKRAHAPAPAPTPAPTPNTAPMRALTAGTMWLAVSMSAIGLIWAALHGGLNPALGRLATELQPLIQDMQKAMPNLPENIDAGKFAWLLARVITPAAVGSGLMLMMANLWLAARTAQISGRLPTPWPDVPYNLRLPVPLAAALIPAIGLIFVGHEIGFVASIVATVLGTALALQGLAVMHDVTRGMSARTPLLFGAYLLLSLIPPWPMPIFAVLGLVDAALGLRERRRLRQSVPPTPPPST
jgi:hypothetical protein